MSAVDTFKGMFGGGQSQQNGGMGGALNKLESLQTRVAKVKRTLQNPALTQFVVVTIPTTLAVAESKRLVQSLQKEKIKVSSILCNQIITEDLGPAYVGTRQRAQRRCIEVIHRAAAAITSGSEGYPYIEITEVPYIDTEVTGNTTHSYLFLTVHTKSCHSYIFLLHKLLLTFTGLYGLKYFSQIAHAPKPKTATNPMSSRKLTIFGGKGGVGELQLCTPQVYLGLTMHIL